MATPNPFAPFASTRPMGAPQLRPMPVPNSNFQKQPSLMTKLAPTAFGLAMESDEAGQAKDYLMGQGKDAFATLTGTAPALGSSAAFSAPAIMGGAEGAIAAQTAAAAASQRTDDKPAYLFRRQAAPARTRVAEHRRWRGAEVGTENA